MNFEEYDDRATRSRLRRVTVLLASTGVLSGETQPLAVMGAEPSMMAVRSSSVRPAGSREKPVTVRSSGEMTDSNCGERVLSAKEKRPFFTLTAPISRVLRPPEVSADFGASFFLSCGRDAIQTGLALRVDDEAASGFDQIHLGNGQGQGRELQGQIRFTFRVLKPKSFRLGPGLGDPQSIDLQGAGDLVIGLAAHAPVQLAAQPARGNVDGGHVRDIGRGDGQRDAGQGEAALAGHGGRDDVATAFTVPVSSTRQDRVRGMALPRSVDRFLAMR
jgi:hypothetical protein